MSRSRGLLRSKTYRGFVRALARMGFAQTGGGKGSHIKWEHPDGRSVSVPSNHMGRSVPVGLLRSMAAQAAGSKQTKSNGEAGRKPSQSNSKANAKQKGSR